MSNTPRLHEEFLAAMWRTHKSVEDAITITSKWVKTAFYTSSWVDIEAWDDFSSLAWRVCKDSYDNSPFVKIADLSSWNFRWPRWFSYTWLPKWYLNTLAPDGIWTKVVLHETLWNVWWLESAAYDLVAMTWDDIVRYGWIPTVFTSVLDVRSIKEREEEYKQMMLRLWQIAAEQRFVILNWETAELWACVWTPNIFAKTAFNWSGMMSWIYHPEKMIYWDKVSEWDILVALKQDWFRSNWLSAVRRAFALEYWENYYETAPRDELLQAAAHSVPYARAVAEAHWWWEIFNKYRPEWFEFSKAPVNITWIAHLSGWSFKWKLLEDMLWKKWLSAEFDNLFPIPEIVKKVAIWSQRWDKPMKSIEELYSTWCAGQWMIVAVDSMKDADKLIRIMANHKVDARISWKVTKTPEWEDPSIRITNVR